MMEYRAACFQMYERYFYILSGKILYLNIPSGHYSSGEPRYSLHTVCYDRMNRA